MIINKKNLQKALEIVKPGLANSEVIEQSTSFAFVGDRVVTYNDNISLSHPVEGLDLDGAIHAEELYNFLNKTDKDKIKVQLTNNKINLQTGSSKAWVLLNAEVKLPLEEIDEQKDWEDLPEEFVSDLDFVKDSASSDMSRRVLTCIHVGETFMETSDGFQIMRTYMPPEEVFPFPGSLIPAENVAEIGKINPVQVAKTAGWLHFRNMDGTELSYRILEDSYPSTDDHFEVKGEEIIFPKKMPEILDRVMVFTKKEQLMDEEMQVLLKNNTLLVKGENEYGGIKEKAKVKYDGEKASFWITPYLLKNILERSNKCILGSEKIKFGGQENRWEYTAVLRGD